MLELHGERLAYRVVGGGHVAREMDMRHVQSVADFVVAVGFAVVGKLAADLKPGRKEEIAQSVFVFVAVEAALCSATFARDQLAIVGAERFAERGEKGGGLGGVGAFFFFRRHFAGAEAIVNFDPRRKIRRGGEVERQRGEIEPALLVLVVVTRGTIFIRVLEQRGRQGGSVKCGR